MSTPVVWGLILSLTFCGGVVPSAILLSMILLVPMYTQSDTSCEFDKYDEPRIHLEKLLSTVLVEFDLSLRILLPLESAGIRTLGDLTRCTRERLLKVPQLGVVSVGKLERFLVYHGLALAEK